MVFISFIFFVFGGILMFELVMMFLKLVLLFVGSIRDVINWILIFFFLEDVRIFIFNIKVEVIIRIVEYVLSRVFLILLYVI